MIEKYEEIRKRLNEIPKVKLGFLPTPLHHLERLSEIMGCDIYLKRDDYAGIGQFGGNKVRKLEYLMAEAVHAKADTIITYGASQSNHAMQTAAASRRLGMKPLLYLVNLLEGEDHPKANMMLDQILGAEIHLEPSHGDSFSFALKRSREKAQVRMKELNQEGHICYEIPMGGANAAGTLGFIEGFLEMTEQTESMKLQMDHLYHASGSGGTLAGLAAGKIILGSDIKIHAVSAGISHDRYKEDVSDLGNEAILKLGIKSKMTTDDFQFHREYAGLGYELPSREAEESMRLLARTEGIFLDPVYTAKAFSCMLDHIHRGMIKKGAKVLFWHTGGIQALFAEKEILGQLL